MVNVSAVYDDHRVLSGVDLSIKAGEKVAVCDQQVKCFQEPRAVGENTEYKLT
ncbi:hypothetical protein LY76DRAFT_588555 [Colletotrichum caudatum]|nr:hypothetical protein LY76DRAFT_588555 [Colletotrichum caudatum]